ncbi:MAG: hypothetical protein H0Z28_06180 [Archaeoglobus sp.]|nr:hypothetical protein [Archaeoglobus sp.]
MDVLIHIPREIAFSVRNRLNVMRIPFEDIRVEVIGVEEQNYQRVLQIVSEIQQQSRDRIGVEG